MPSTIDQLVRLRAQHDADTPMVIDPTARISYRELDTTTRDLARRSSRPAWAKAAGSG